MFNFVGRDPGWYFTLLLWHPGFLQFEKIEFFVKLLQVFFELLLFCHSSAEEQGRRGSVLLLHFFPRDDLPLVRLLRSSWLRIHDDLLLFYYSIFASIFFLNIIDESLANLLRVGYYAVNLFSMLAFGNGFFVLFAILALTLFLFSALLFLLDLLQVFLDILVHLVFLDLIQIFRGLLAVLFLLGRLQVFWSILAFLFILKLLQVF